MYDLGIKLNKNTPEFYCTRNVIVHHYYYYCFHIHNLDIIIIFIFSTAYYFKCCSNASIERLETDSQNTKKPFKESK